MKVFIFRKRKKGRPFKTKKAMSMGIRAQLLREKSMKTNDLP